MSTRNVTPFFSCLDRGRNEGLTIFLLIVAAASALGISTGCFVFVFWNDNLRSRERFLIWSGLFGDIIFRILKLLVVPYVMVGVVSAMYKLSGDKTTLRWVFPLLFLTTSGLAAGIGIFGGKVLVAWITSDDNNDFTWKNNVTKVDTDWKDDFPVDAAIYSGIFEEIFPSNIFAALSDGNLAGIITFSLVVGYHMRLVTRSITDNPVADVLEYIEEIFRLAIQSILYFLPVAVLTIVMNAFGGYDIYNKNIILYVTVALFTEVTYFILVDGTLVFLALERNGEAVWKFCKSIALTQAIAFAFSSSAVTIPWTQMCIEKSECDVYTLRHLVVPLSATVNMDGTAAFLPVLLMFLATINGHELEPGTLGKIWVFSVLGSISTPPLPSAALAYAVIIYNLIFDETGTPDGYVYIVAVDFLLDRFRTVVNVTGDCVNVVVMPCLIAFIRNDSRFIEQYSVSALTNPPSQNNNVKMTTSNDPDDTEEFEEKMVV